ncbi:MAG: hypothetical protein KAS04_05675 [Candidatus Aenigmarchaeota archaeon]|nr:hypothetical protein [Candidatus Aenigmarchaeota archaeon]
MKTCEELEKEMDYVRKILTETTNTGDDLFSFLEHDREIQMVAFLGNTIVYKSDLLQEFITFEKTETQSDKSSYHFNVKFVGFEEATREKILETNLKKSETIPELERLGASRLGGVLPDGSVIYEHERLGNMMLYFDMEGIPPGSHQERIRFQKTEFY